MKVIKPFVNFNFKNANKLGKKKKALINKAFKTVAQNAGIGNARFIKTKSKKNVKKLAALFGNDLDANIFKGAFVPISKIGEKGKVKFNKDGSFSITVPDVQGFPDQKFFSIDPKQFAKKGMKYIQELISDMPDNLRFAPVSATAGPLIGSARTPQGYQSDKAKLIDLLNGWLASYTVSGKTGHAMRDWLTGIQVIEEPQSILE